MVEDGQCGHHSWDPESEGEFSGKWGWKYGKSTEDFRAEKQEGDQLWCWLSRKEKMVALTRVVTVESVQNFV